jgi:hypothetical protein
MFDVDTGALVEIGWHLEGLIQPRALCQHKAQR